VQPDADALEGETELPFVLTQFELALVDAEVGPCEPESPSETLVQGDASEQTFEVTSGSWGRRDLDWWEGLRERD
jgi:hypothetical protein